MVTKKKTTSRKAPRTKAGRKPFLKGAKTFSVTLDQSDYQDVERLADKRGVSIAAIIPDAVKAYTARRKG